MWSEGGDGAVYQFDGEDKFGKAANITLQNAADKIGFIVRTDSWEKDISEDRFIDTSISNEIWVFTGESEFFYEAPEGYADELNIDSYSLKLEYKRYDKDYSDLRFRFD